MVEIIEIEELLSYCPGTVVLRWKVARGRSRKGSIAGYDTGRGYVGVRVNGKFEYAHRIAFLLMTGKIPQFVDHISGDRSDNRWLNLRETDRSGNGMNMKRPSHNTSGVIGVFWNKGVGKWTAKIKKNQITTNLGNFINFEDAVSARKKAEEDLGFHMNHGRDF